MCCRVSKVVSRFRRGDEDDEGCHEAKVDIGGGGV